MFIGTRCIMLDCSCLQFWCLYMPSSSCTSGKFWCDSVNFRIVAMLCCGIYAWDAGESAFYLRSFGTSGLWHDSKLTDNELPLKWLKAWCISTTLNDKSCLKSWHLTTSFLFWIKKVTNLLLNCTALFIFNVSNVLLPILVYWPGLNFRTMITCRWS